MSGYLYNAIRHAYHKRIPITIKGHRGLIVGIHETIDGDDSRIVSFQLMDDKTTDVITFFEDDVKVIEGDPIRLS